SMVKYHMGIFGFTGVGKSNLTSVLVRMALGSLPDLNVVIFDVAGEYPVHLVDLVSKSGEVFSTEDFRGDAERFLSSQAVPESLEEHVGGRLLEHAFDDAFREGRVRRLSLAVPEGLPRLSLGYVADLLRKTSEDKGSGGVPATRALQELSSHFFRKSGLSPEVDVAELAPAEKERLVSILSKLAQSVHSMSALSKDIGSLIDYVQEPAGPTVAPPRDEEEPSIMTPSALAGHVLGDGASRLSIVYVPEPDEARLCVSEFIGRLLLLKKTAGLKRRVLVVLDEAQEFIPDRTLRADYSDQSNRAVEALLRQGRKYRAHCWVSTQRVAHLNVNALQQLHTYFVSTLPRFYDRMVIADAFSLSYDVLERTTELETGEWLFVSYRATRQKNVPAFLRTQNNEELVKKALQTPAGRQK
ncbi:MAG: ATP-binding protein, partial [Candidatus Bathyarchaeia archaeon]